jgi:DNA-binding CsgD family transcriptional regulator
MTPQRLLSAALDLAEGAAAVRTAGELDRAVWPHLAVLVGVESLVATGFDGRLLCWPPGVGADVARRSGHRAVLAVGRAGAEACVALHRAGRGFTDHDLALLDLVRPHLADALWRATPPQRLTARERSVVAHVARGATDAAIAHELGISRRTVGKHLENAYAALGVHDRTSAALLAGTR